MATITYTATFPSGQTVTRTSGTMFYTHMSFARGSWHTSLAAAVKAGDPVPAVPTAVNGRAAVGDFARSPQAAAIDALIEAKNAAAAAKAAPAPQAARVKRGPTIKGKLGKAERVGRASVLGVRQLADAAERDAGPGVLIGTLHTNQDDAADGGPIGHLCECLAAVADFTISHGAECPSAPPRQIGDTAPPSLF